MAIPRPKILSSIITDSVYQLKFYVSAAADYDTAVTISIPAGTYYVAWDNQSDDLIYVINNLMCNAINALGTLGTPDFNSVTDTVVMWIDSSNKVNIGFGSTVFQGAQQRKVKIAWTELQGPTIAKWLGFDGSADDTLSASNNPIFTADYQHGWAWYADEDGLLRNYSPVDDWNVKVIQAVSDSGRVSTQRIGQNFTAHAALQFISQGRMFSNGMGYGDASVYPYSRNVGLECWWDKAILGKPFRFYADGYLSTGRAANSGQATGGTTTTLTDTAKTLTTDPQQYAGRLLYIPSWDATLTGSCARFYISSHTGTVYTVPNAHAKSQALNAVTTQYYVLDQPYATYVLDASKHKAFEYTERDALARFDIDLHFRRYVT